MVTQEKADALQARLQKLGVKNFDLDEKFVLGSGPGGQKINKTSSCVHLTHLPTAIQIKCQKTRSRELNRFYARRELCERLEKILLNQKTAKEKECSKIRRQKARRSRKSKLKLVEDKRRSSAVKSLRKSPKEHSKGDPE